MEREDSIGNEERGRELKKKQQIEENEMREADRQTDSGTGGQNERKGRGKK